MSTSSLPLPFLVPPLFEQKVMPPLPCKTTRKARAMVRRRANMEQGKGLEVLGHAIEYLVDSRMFLVGDARIVIEADAVRVLSRCSRELFLSCAVIVPLGARLRTWAAGQLRIQGKQPHASRD